MKLIYEKVIMEIAPKIIKKNREDILITIERLIEKYLIDNIKFLVLLDRIDELIESELDMVQEELHVDFYNYSMSVEEKRKSCKESLGVHMTKGTPGSVKKVLEIFFKNASLKEWYQYNGTPGYFKILIDGESPQNLGEVFSKIENVKKKSQHLEKISFLSKSEITLNAFSHKRNGIRQKHYQAPISFSFESTDLKSNSGNRQQVTQGRNNGSF